MEGYNWIETFLGLVTKTIFSMKILFMKIAQIDSLKQDNKICSVACKCNYETHAGRGVLAQTTYKGNQIRIGY